MKKRLLAILMATAMSMTLIACGSEESAVAEDTAIETENIETADETTAAEYTDEQLALAEEYVEMCEAYNAAVDLINATPELASQQELIDAVNELTAVIEEADAICADPSLLTPEVMEGLRVSFDNTYAFIDSVNAAVEGIETTNSTDLASILTIAYAGADEEENTYYFVCDDAVSFGAIVLLSTDMTQSMNCVGEIVDNGDGSLTINDETGYTITFMVEEAEGGLILTLDDGTIVGMAPWDTQEVLDMIIAIDEGTEILN